MDRPYIEDKAFEKTNFSETPLKKGDYEACAFSSCDISNADLSEFRFIDCSFTACKMLGLQFENCQLNHSSFYRVKLGRIRFINCALLEKADFITAFNYVIDPENNYIRGAKFSMPSVTGLLNKYDIDIQ